MPVITEEAEDRSPFSRFYDCSWPDDIEIGAEDVKRADWRLMGYQSPREMVDVCAALGRRLKGTHGLLTGNLVQAWFDSLGHPWERLPVSKVEAGELNALLDEINVVGPVEALDNLS